MVGNLTAVAAAPARASTPSTRDSAVPAALAGKSAPAAGENLPVRAAASAAEIERAARRLNETLAATNRSLSFRVDKDSGRTVITVVDAATQEVVRQIPSEEVLALSSALERASGLLDALA
jgi:flagellar protein FlaG